MAKEPHMADQLPTFTSAAWTVTALLDSLRRELQSDTFCDRFYIFSYAVTIPGWEEIREVTASWRSGRLGREVRGYFGTDHALTDPDALREMREAQIAVRVMTTYSGVFHPKVFWLFGPDRQMVWVGSNNLTRDGLLQNIEFSTLIKSPAENPNLRRWFDSVHAGSEPLSDGLLSSYAGERRKFAESRAATGTFTWSMRKETAAPTRPATSTAPTRSIVPKRGDLIVEVMPLETGLDGKQMQLPKKSQVLQFFGLSDVVGATRRITLNPVGTNALRQLTLTIFANKTWRLSINELDYRDRPCVILFHKSGRSSYSFEIISRSIYPDRYGALLGRCNPPTRAGSRRWAIL